VGEHKKEGGVKKRGILLIKSELGSEIIPGVIEGMHFIHPEGLFIKEIKSQCKTYEQTENEDKYFFLLHFIRLAKCSPNPSNNSTLNIPMGDLSKNQSKDISMLFSFGDLGSQSKR
jgi:hypothetical protein